MFRTPASRGAQADSDAVAALIVQCRRLSRRLLLAALMVSLVCGAVAVAVTLDGYQGLGGKYLGARIGWTFCAAAGCSLSLALVVRAWLVRRALAQWIEAMVALGADRTGLAEEVEAFLPAGPFGSFRSRLRR